MRIILLLLSVYLLSMSSGCTKIADEGFEYNDETAIEANTNRKADISNVGLEVLNQKSNDNKSSNTWLTILVVFLILLNFFILVVAVIIPLRKYPSKHKMISDLLEDDQIRSIINNQVKYQISQTNMPREKIIPQPVISEKKINEITDVIVQRALECVNLELNNLKDITENTTIQVDKSVKPSIEVLFYRSKNGKILQEAVSEKEGLFKIFDVADNDAKFEYCGGVINPDFFIDICDFVNNPRDIPDFTSIETIVPGEVKKNNNGNWEVIKTAKIKFK